MKKTRFYVILCVVIAAFIASAPALYARISNEDNNMAVVAVKVDDITGKLLGEYEKNGASAAVISESAGGGFDKKALDKAASAGLMPVLSVDASGDLDESYVKEIGLLAEEYGIQYLNLYGEAKVDEGNEFLCRIIEENRLTLVLTETKTQLSNERFSGYDDCIKSADGRVLRGYNSDKRNSLNRIDYDLNYYQMLNSLIDRNIRFFMVQTIVDKDYSDAVNSERTLRAVNRFTQKLKDLGYTSEGSGDLAGYSVNRRLVSSASAALMAVMALLAAGWIFGKKRAFDITAVFCGFLFMLAAWIVPERFLWVYPTLYSIAAPCFVITAVLAFVIKWRGKLSYFKLCLSGAAIAVLMLCAANLMLSALLSGADYYLNSNVFRGVKLSLIFPVFYSGVLFLFAKGENGRIKLKTIKEILAQYMKKRYIISFAVAVAVIGAAAIVYLKRSGNAMIPFGEAYIRNEITDLILARPRTKEFVFAWPAFVLFLYYAKKFPDGIFQWIFASAAGMLFASVINTFCHVFTPVKIMYLRVIHGIWMSLPFVLAALLVNFVIIKLVHEIKRTQR